MTTTANADGGYVVSFSSVSVVPGDMVYATAASRTISLHVESLTGQVEPVTDYVRGTAPPSRSLSFYVSSYQGCDTKNFSQWATSDNTGSSPPVSPAAETSYGETKY